MAGGNEGTWSSCQLLVRVCQYGKVSYVTNGNYGIRGQHILRSYGDVTECRKVLQLAINSVTEDVELLYDCLIQLEQDKGLY